MLQLRKGLFGKRLKIQRYLRLTAKKHPRILIKIRIRPLADANRLVLLAAFVIFASSNTKSADRCHSNTFHSQAGFHTHDRPDSIFIHIPIPYKNAEPHAERSRHKKGIIGHRHVRKFRITRSRNSITVTFYRPFQDRCDRLGRFFIQHRDRHIRQKRDTLV